MQKKPPITERLIWRANYSEGDPLWERDPKTHKENFFKDIQMDKLVSFDLMKPMDDVDEALMGETEVRVESMLHKGMPALITLKVYHKMQQPFLHVDLPKPKRLIFTRKKRITTGRDIANVPVSQKDPKAPPEIMQVPFPALEIHDKVLIVVGWQETINGKNVQAINYVYPSGMIELGGEWKKDAIHSEVEPYDVNTHKQQKK